METRLRASEKTVEEQRAVIKELELEEHSAGDSLSSQVEERWNEGQGDMHTAACPKSPVRHRGSKELRDVCGLL